MVSPQPDVDNGPGPCPRCATTLPPLTGHEPPVVSCPSCGHPLPTPALVELASLRSWSRWSEQRSQWLRDRIAAGEPIQAAVPRPGTAAAMAGPPMSAGGVLLAFGALLLVLAGIAFLAFAWDLLGPVGQVAVLFAIGGLGLAAGVRLADRLPGTATTLGAVGALLIASSTVASRSLGVAVLAETGALVLSLAAALALTAAGVRVRRTLPAVGELAGGVGAVLALLLLALAPADGAIPIGGRWAWWAAVVLLAGSVALLLLAERLPLRVWPSIAGVGLSAGALVLGGYAQEALGQDLDELRPLLFAAVLLVAALALVGLHLALHGRRRQPSVAAAVVGLVALTTTLLAGWATAQIRPWAALLLLVVGALVVLVPRAARTLDAPLLPAPLEVRVSALLGLVVLGAGVGILVAPWLAWPDDAWPSWRGPVTGLVLAAWLVGTGEFARRLPAPQSRPDLLALAAAASATASWLLAHAATLGSSVQDRPVGPPAEQVGPWLEAAHQALAVTLVLLAVAGWAVVLRRSWPVWAVVAPAVAMIWSQLLWLDLAGRSPATDPELAAVLLAWPALASGVVGWRRQPTPTSTLLTLAPGLLLAALPTTRWVLGEAAGQWWTGDDPSTAYQVRVVGLFVVGALLTVAGAWRRIAGLFAPGLVVLLVVSAIQLVELGRFLPQWMSFAVAGSLLVAAGARWEAVRRTGRHTATWARHLR